MKKSPLCRMLLLILAMTMFLSVPVAAEDTVIIVLDPGHGGMDTGSEQVYDGVCVCESELNLQIAEACRDYLEENYRNVRVYMTREGDTRMDLEARTDFAASVDADYMLSIHLNAYNGSSRGAVALVPRGRYNPEQAAASVRTAEVILTELEKLGLKNRGALERLSETNDRYPDGSLADYYGIVRGCVLNNIPGIIVEHGYLDNASDYRSFMNTPEKLAALGKADALGLAKSLGLEERGPVTSAELGDTPFEDVFEGVWYYDAVTYVWDQGLMEGTGETRFAPDAFASRAMVVTLLYRMEGDERYPEESSFADVELGSWYHAPVEWALETGITSGVSETEFAPEENVSREQFVTFLHRYAGLPDPTAVPDQFSDWKSVDDYAEAAMAWAVETGIVTGYEDGTVKPLRALNRAELAAMIQRFHRWFLHNRGELVYEWTQSKTTAELNVGESFQLTLVNQYGEVADPEWLPDCDGVVEINGTTVTAVGEGSALLSCEWDGQYFDCLVEVKEKTVTWSISHTDVTIKVGESFNLRLRSSEGETATVTWSPSKTGYVTISGNKITGKKVGTVNVTCVHEGVTYKCIVRVKSA